jgi:hypothetical protein
MEPVETAVALEAAPDYAGALLAWRLWAVEDVAGSARLRSMYRSCVWPVGMPFTARCQSRRFRLWRRRLHDAPETHCTCGIYAVPVDFLPGLSRDGSVPPARTVVIGAVSLWGDVVECERGWRAGVAYPAHIFVPGICSRLEETVAGLGDYGVPVEVVEGLNITAVLAAVMERAA